MPRQGAAKSGAEARISVENPQLSRIDAEAAFIGSWQSGSLPQLRERVTVTLIILLCQVPFTYPVDGRLGMVQRTPGTAVWLFGISSASGLAS